MKTTLILPTWNEIESIPHVLPTIKPGTVDELIIIDNNSTDGTGEWCRSHGYTVLNQKSRGYGNAIREAIAQSSGDIIVEFPPDGNSLPEKIPELIEKIKSGYDMVIASRYLNGAKSYDDDWLTGFGNFMFTLLTNIIFGTHYTDVLVGYRAHRRAAYDTLGLNEPHLAWVMQSSIRFPKYGFKVGEIGADEPKRIGGTRKMRPFKTGVSLLRVMWREFWSPAPHRL